MRSASRNICCFFVVLTLSVAMAFAQAPQTIFDLGGTAGPSPTSTNPYVWPNDANNCVYGPCDYWNELNGTGNNSSTGGVGANSVAGHSSVRTFVSGTASTPSFTGGGSKDPSDLSQWAYSSTPTPNKDTLNAGYAAAYNVGDFDVIFGADRLSPNGDANIGIWFFQQNVCLGGTGNFIQCGTSSVAHHVNGDVLVLSAFTGGGGTSTVAVYTWNTACTAAAKNPSPGPVPGSCGAANLELLFNSSQVCVGSAPACGRTNGATIPATWATYSNGQIASPLFFDGGVDITQLFANTGLPLPCFASFLEETRSSQSPTAVLKDFLLGNFPVCSISVTKACGQASLSSDGTTATFPVNGTVTNTGIGTLYDVQVVDAITGGATNTITIGTLPAGQSANWSDSGTSTTSTSQTDTATAKGAPSEGASLSVTSSSVTKTCTVQVTNTLTVSKSCSTSLVASGGTPVHVAVAYGGQVCNTGNSKVTNVNLTDYADDSTASNGTFGPFSLNPGACTPYASSYTPTSIDGGNGTDGGRYFFNDLIVISSATSQFGTLTPVSGSTDGRINGTYGSAIASCPICPANSCAP